MKITFEQAVQELQEAENAVILTHRKPDGDTLGSAAALCRGLRAMGKKAWVLKNPEVTPRYRWLLEGLEKDYAEGGDFIISTDVADKALLPDNAGGLGISLAFDHHPSFKDFAEKGFCDPGSASCGEIIFRFIKALRLEFDKDMASAVYTAAATDTGCFNFDNTTAFCHETAAECIRAGADYKRINYNCFRLKTKARVALEGYIYSHMSLTCGGRAACAVLTRDFIESIGADDDDTDNLSSLMGQIDGIEVGSLLTQTKDRMAFKVSMRSRNVNVSEICALFGGGGHVSAAGCTIEGAAAKERIERAVGERLGF